MAYRPRTETTTNEAQKFIGTDSKRTTVTITNLSGETCYWGVDPTLTTGNGAPIFNNGRAEFNFINGRDPRIARFIIGTVGGDIRIDEEASNEPDPFSVIAGILTDIKNLLMRRSG